MRSIAAISVNIAGEDILIVLATPRSTSLPLITIWLDYLSLDSAWLELECHWHELHTKCEIYSEIIQFVIIILNLKYNSLSQCHYLWLRTLTAALFYIFQAPSMLSKDIWRIFLILFRLSSVGLWIIAWVWLDWTLAGEWFKDKNDCLINCWGWVVRKYGGQMRALTYYQHKSGFYQIKKIISYGSAWMDWEVFSVEHYDQRKNILNHTPPLNKIPSQSHRIILWPSKSLRISQPFHLENSPKNSWREYSWVIWCFGPLGKFRFLWHSN